MKIKLVGKKQVSKGTKSFVFETEKKTSCLPGQYVYVTLPKLTFDDPRGATRHFTLSVSPTEGPLWQITTRMRETSGFKKTLDALAMGTELIGDGPEGTFILDESEKGDHVLIAGGIGITPFRSMIKYAVDKKLNTQIFLIYSDSTPEDMAFKNELEKIVKSYPNIKVEFIFSQTQGRLDQTKVEKLIENWKLEIENFTWWLCGPPAFVESMEKVLGSLKVTSNKIRSEKFSGY